MGSASEYSYHSESEDEGGGYNGGEAKKCSPVGKSHQGPYSLLAKEDLTRHKDEVR